MSRSFVFGVEFGLAAVPARDSQPGKREKKGELGGEAVRLTGSVSRLARKARGRRGRKHVGYEVLCVTLRPGIVRWHGLGYFVCHEENPFLRH